MHRITGVFSEIIDSKSKYTRNHSNKLSKKISVIAEYYGFNEEKRPYRNCLNHQEAMVILNRMAGEGKLNIRIIEDIDKIFGD